MICPMFVYGLILHLNRILSMQRSQNWPPSFSGEVGAPLCTHTTWNDVFSA